MGELAGLATLIAASIVSAWSGFRAWRANSKLVKWGGAGLASLLSTAATVLSIGIIVGLVRLNARSASAPDLKVAVTAEQIQRGRAIVDGFCSACHSKTGTPAAGTATAGLDVDHLLPVGGVDVGRLLPVPVGSLVASNLTPAGQLARWSDGDIFRAIRNGVDRDGHWLIVMSYTNAGRLSDDDTQAVIAYLRSLPAAGTPTRNPPDHLNLLGIAMLGVGMLPQGKPVATEVVQAPPKGRTLKYGEYILSYQDCRECHGRQLTGGVPGQLGPLGPDLNLVKQWTPEEFIATMRTGIDPGGHQVSKEMPWKTVGRMDDDELGAIYEYLTHLTAS